MYRLVARSLCTPAVRHCHVQRTGVLFRSARAFSVKADEGNRPLKAVQEEPLPFSGTLHSEPVNAASSSQNVTPDTTTTTTSSEATTTPPEKQQKELVIPDVPSVSGYPTPWISETDYEPYIHPLYKLGWGIEFKRHERVKNPKDIAHSDPLTGNLVTEFTFRRYSKAVAFVNEVARIAEQENHHPRVAIIPGTDTKVRISTQTHSAIRPIWEEDGSEAADSHRRIAGVTLRDLRLAALIESHYATQYLSPTTQNASEKAGETPKAKDITRRGVMQNGSQRPRWDKIVKSWKLYSLPSPEKTIEKSRPQPTPRKRVQKCPACGEAHTLTSCKLRAQIRPPRPCKICSGEHWVTDCPNRRSRARPTQRCPNCGGKHFLADCRKPQIPKELAEKMILPV